MIDTTVTAERGLITVQRNDVFAGHVDADAIVCVGLRCVKVKDEDGVGPFESDDKVGLMFETVMYDQDGVRRTGNVLAAITPSLTRYTLVAQRAI